MRKTVLAIIAGLLLVSVVSALTVLAYVNRQNTVRSFQQQHRDLAKAATHIVELAVSSGRVDAVQTFLGDLQANPLFKGAVVYDEDGDAVLIVPQDFEIPPSAAEVVLDTETVTSGAVAYEARLLRDLDGEAIGHLLLALSFESMNRQARKTLVYTILVGVVILVPITAFIGWLLTWMEKKLQEHKLVKEALGQSEEHLRQAQKMEAIGQLTGGIAHDFNNLLTVILANADLIGAALPPEENGVRPDLEELRAAARRGAGMVKKLLGFSRLEVLSFRPVDIPRLVDGLAMTLRRLLPESIEIRVSSDKHVPRARADPGAVEQILVNLATNARDAMPDGGLLHVETRRGWLDEEHRATYGWGDPGQYVCLFVSDTGVGMDEPTKQKVFEPFFTTKPVGEGTGLGMAMLYGLVKQHHGFVDVYSEVEQGTTVKIYFPLAPGQAPTGAPGQELGELRGGSETILLVEDEAPIRRAARRVLERYGYTLLLAENGEKALRMFRAHRSEIALVISDVVMPKLSGPEFYKAVRRETEAIKFIFTSGYTARDVRTSRAFDPTMPFLHKPWTVPELVGLVREVLDEETIVESSSGEHR